MSDHQKTMIDEMKSLIADLQETLILQEKTIKNLEDKLYYNTLRDKYYDC